MTKQTRRLYRDSEGERYQEYLLDAVTLGTKMIVVPQENGTWPPYAMVTSSRMWQRKPQGDQDVNPYRSLKHFEPLVFETPPGCKWCSRCGEWVDARGYSADTRNRDGLHVWCKSCRAIHARRMYWLQKAA